MARRRQVFTPGHTAAEGAGFKVVGDPKKEWFGPGYCAICGHTDPDSPRSPLVPVRVRFYDPDDGWKTGVLCTGCADECCSRGPRKDDYAVATGKVTLQPEKLDAIDATLAGDDDGAYTESEDERGA